MSNRHSSDVLRTMLTSDMIASIDYRASIREVARVDRTLTADEATLAGLLQGAAAAAERVADIAEEEADLIWDRAVNGKVGARQLLEVVVDCRTGWSRYVARGARRTGQLA